MHTSITEKILCDISPKKNGGIGISTKFKSPFIAYKPNGYSALLNIFENRRAEQSMNSDKKHLQWIYGRMLNHHKENPKFTYMDRLAEIINQIPQRPCRPDELRFLELCIYPKLIARGENPNYDYMHKLKEIIDSNPTLFPTNK